MYDGRWRREALRRTRSDLTTVALAVSDSMGAGPPHSERRFRMDFKTIKTLLATTAGALAIKIGAALTFWLVGRQRSP